MEKLGIEIRKKGSIKNLYKDVDLILSQFNNTNKSVTRTLQQQTTAHALQKMFKPDKYLDVCTIRDCSMMCDLVIPAERMQIYNSIHCLHWNEMTEEYRMQIISMVLDDFRQVLNIE